MRQAYDVFEKLPDGSTLWHTFLIGRFEAHRRLQELAEYSENECFLVAVTTTDLPAVVPAPKRWQSSRKSTVAG
jgi:hypothetical protein